MSLDNDKPIEGNQPTEEATEASPEVNEEVSEEAAQEAAEKAAEELALEIAKKTAHMKWYVVHAYSGYEYKVKSALEEQIRLAGKEDFFGEILVPCEQVVDMVKGVKKTSSRKFFPGYILVQMDLNDDTWHIVNDTPKITGFVGGMKNPPPISKEELLKITTQMEEGAVRPKPKVLFETGENVRVIDGPFMNFTGHVEEVKPEKGRLRVMVSIFGRPTPVELDFVQVEKA